jgi:hypothetical protein
MSTGCHGVRRLIVLLGLAFATTAHAVDVSGEWAVCLSLDAGFGCPATLTATLVGTAPDQFTMTFGYPASCSLGGTVDGGTGAMTASGSCLAAGGYFSGTATDTTMSGTIGLSGALCAYDFQGVRSCGACDDGVECTTDGCGTTACSAPASSCTHAEATPGATCTDGSTCTNGDHCEGTTCSGYAVNCGDNNPCTTEYCVPDVGCVFDFNSNPCNDGDACTTGDTCSEGQCVGGPATVCGRCERCSPVLGCLVGPKSGCRTPVDPKRSSLVLKNNPSDTRDKLTWKWTNGQATTAADFGDPVASDDYTLCVFDQVTTTPRIVLASSAPAASTCPFGASGAPCWKGSGTPPGASGFTYRNAGLFSPDGLARVKLVPGAAGRAKVYVKGQGTNLEMPATLDVTPPVRVQLQAENGQCWETTYPTALQDREDVFRAKGGN